MDFSHEVKDNIHFPKTLTIYLLRHKNNNFFHKLCYSRILIDNNREVVEITFILFI